MRNRNRSYQIIIGSLIGFSERSSYHLNLNLALACLKTTNIYINVVIFNIKRANAFSMIGQTSFVVLLSVVRLSVRRLYIILKYNIKRDLKLLFIQAYYKPTILLYTPERSFALGVVS